MKNKTKVKFLNSTRSGLVKGEVGYIDGYITYNTLHPKCMIVTGKRVLMSDPKDLEVIEEKNNDRK